MNFRCTTNWQFDILVETTIMNFTNLDTKNEEDFNMSKKKSLSRWGTMRWVRRHWHSLTPSKDCEGTGGLSGG